MIQFFDNCLVKKEMPELRPDLAGLQPTQAVDSTTLREPVKRGDMTAFRTGRVM